MLFRCFLLFLLLPLTLFCTNDRKERVRVAIVPTTDYSDFFVVDFDKTEVRDTLSLSFFFKSAVCVRLDDENDKSLIGSIDKLVVFNEKLYVLDGQIAKGLFVFDWDGRFIRKIGSLGQGPGEYINIRDFTLNTDNNEIIILDNHKILFFNFDGNFLKSFFIVKENNLILTFQYYNGLLYSCVFPLSEKKENDYLLQSINKDDGSVVSRFLKTDEHNKGFNGAFKGADYFIPKLDPPYLFRHMFMDTIFSITEKGLSPYIALKSKDFVTEKDIVISRNKSPLSVIEFVTGLKNKNRIYRIFNFFETDDYFHFRYTRGAESKSIIFNRKDMQVQTVGNLRNDLIYKTEQPSAPPRFAFYDKKGVYEIVEGRKLYDFLPFLWEKKLKEPFNEQLKGLTEDSNPIIFYYEFK